MSILRFFEDVEKGRVQMPLNTEYARLARGYEASGDIVKEMVKEEEIYRLTDSGKEYLSNLRKLPDALASGFMEGAPEDW